ncbi:MAG: right-handed parallel beta-helix repeat-containing protein [Ferruginibacter sp.]
MKNIFLLPFRKDIRLFFGKNIRTYFKNYRRKMVRPNSCCIYLILLFWCTAHVNAQTQKKVLYARAYYLNTSGNDENKGTRNSPWKTIQKINSIYLSAGDTVLFKAGQIFIGTLLLDSNSEGRRGQPILVTAYGKGKSIIDAGNESAMIIKKTKFITIKKLKLSGSGRKNGNSGNGLSLLNCSNVLVNDLDISGFRNSGVSVYTSSDIRVIGVDAHDNGFAGISISGEYLLKKSCSNVYIGYCKAFNNPGSPVILDNHSGNGIVAGNCSKLTIEYCVATDNGWDMPRIGNGPVGIWCYEADSVVIQHCISYRNKTSVGGDDGGGFDLDGGVTNSVIQYCLSYENQGSGFGIFQYAGASAWHNNTIRYNISENDGTVSAARAGIYIWNSSDDSLQFYNCLIYNNTIYNGKGYAINFAGQSQRKGFLLYNNIFVAGDTLLKGKRSNDTFLANDWWSLKNKFNIEGIINLEEWAKKSGQEIMAGKVVGLNKDPGFKKTGGSTLTSCRGLKLFDPYKISSHSPLSRMGLNLHILYGIETGGVDFNGQPAPVKGIGASFIKD